VCFLQLEFLVKDIRLKKDLYLLVADSSMAKALEAALLRHESLEIRPIQFKIDPHPYRDPGVRTTGAEMLALQVNQFSHCIMVLDFEGSGTQYRNAIELETELDRNLQPIWNSNAKTIVIDPELDIWMWGGDNALKDALGWTEDISLREWLKSQNMQFFSNEKPMRPKEALEKLFSKLRRPRSSSIYGSIASKISLQRCNDPSFLRLKNALIRWFPK
jgi:hypothetical protein